MSVKSKKLRDVTFYLHHIDMQLKEKGKKNKKKKKIPRPLTYMQVVFKHWPEFISVAMTMREKSYCNVYHSHETSVTFSEPTAAWLHSQNLVSWRRGGSKGAQSRHDLLSLKPGSFLPRHVGGHNKLRNVCLFQHW